MKIYFMLHPRVIREIEEMVAGEMDEARVIERENSNLTRDMSSLLREQRVYLAVTYMKLLPIWERLRLIKETLNRFLVFSG